MKADTHSHEKTHVPALLYYALLPQGIAQVNIYGHAKAIDVDGNILYEGRDFDAALDAVFQLREKG